MIGLCDNCALKYADCKGDKGLEKTRCDYYKKPIVMNVKELAERVAELEIENERLRKRVEVTRCRNCSNFEDGISIFGVCKRFGRNVTINSYCSYGEPKEV